MIKSFKCKDTESIFRRSRSKKFPTDLQRKMLMKLQMLNRAVVLKDLSIPPGNMLERLKGDREGQYSIRVNDQWRVCFRWEEGDAFDVEIVDYHK